MLSCGIFDLSEYNNFYEKFGQLRKFETSYEDAGVVGIILEDLFCNCGEVIVNAKLCL